MGVLVAPVSPPFLCQSGGSDHLPPSWADHLPISCILLVHLSPFPMPICLLPIAAIPPTLWSSSPGIHRGPSVFWLLAFCSVCTTGQDKLASSLDLFLPASSVSHEVTATKAFPLASAELSDFFFYTTSLSNTLRPFSPAQTCALLSKPIPLGEIHLLATHLPSLAFESTMGYLCQSTDLMIQYQKWLLPICRVSWNYNLWVPAFENSINKDQILTRLEITDERQIVDTDSLAPYTEFFFLILSCYYLLICLILNSNFSFVPFSKVPIHTSNVNSRKLPSGSLRDLVQFRNSSCQL